MRDPQQLFYTQEHVWVQQTADQNWLVGITDYAQEMLGDVVFIEPPKPAQKIMMGTACGIVESVKTGSDLHAPLNGIVNEINEALLASPEALNDKPYDAWIFKFKADDPATIATLMSAVQYESFIASK